MSKRHHYIPEFYLKPWTSGRQKELVQFSRLPDGRVVTKHVSPGATGYVDRLYALKNVPPDMEDFFEREFFSQVDSLAAVVRDRMIARETTFSREERIAWTHFLVSMIFRHPQNVEGMERRLLADVTNADPGKVSRWVKGNGDPASVAEVLEMLKAPEGSKRLALNTLYKVISGLNAISTLASLQWGAFEKDFDSPALLTSDRPIFWPTGLAATNFALLMPITPRLVFYAVQPDFYPTLQFWALDSRNLVSFLNDNVTRRAREFVYGFSKGALPFVQARMCNDPPLTLTDRLLDLRQAKNEVDRAP